MHIITAVIDCDVSVRLEKTASSVFVSTRSNVQITAMTVWAVIGVVPLLQEKNWWRKANFETRNWPVQWQEWGLRLCPYIIVYGTLPPSQSNSATKNGFFWLSLSTSRRVFLILTFWTGLPCPSSRPFSFKNQKWLPLNFRYNDVMCTAPFVLLCYTECQ